MEMVTDGDVLKKLIEKAKLKQEEVASMLGVSRVSVSKMTKRGRLSEDWKLKICKAFNVSKDVFSGKDIGEISIVKGVDPDYIKISQNEYSKMLDLINIQKEMIENLKEKMSNE